MMIKSILIILCFSIISFAQNIPSVSRGSLQFYTDYSCFRGNDNKTVVEVYIMLYADQLKYTRTSDKLNADYKVNVVVKDTNGILVEEQSWTSEVNQKVEESNLKSLAIYDQWHADLIPGRYILSLQLDDSNGGTSGIAETNLDVPLFVKDTFQLSQIEFVNSVENSNVKTVFSKGDQQIIPNPARRYGAFNKTLYLYYEIYNISQNHNDKLEIKYLIVDKDAGLVKLFPEIKKEKNNSNAAIIHGVDVSQIPTGVYKFKVEVNDNSNNKKVETEKYFEVVQMDYVSKNPVFTEEQAEAAANQIKYFASSREMDLYNSLNLTGKAQFIIRFWNDKDPTPDTEENEFLEDIQHRFQYANINFSTGKTEGWSTDRGRILIKYGNPDEIENHHFETGTAPYEVWMYRERKNYQFVFADLQFNGTFVLIHSSKEGEIANFNWRELIKRM